MMPGLVSIQMELNQHKANGTFGPVQEREQAWLDARLSDYYFRYQPRPQRSEPMDYSPEMRDLEYARRQQEINELRHRGQNINVAAAPTRSGRDQLRGLAIELRHNAQLLEALDKSLPLEISPEVDALLDKFAQKFRA